MTWFLLWMALQVPLGMLIGTWLKRRRRERMEDME